MVRKYWRSIGIVLLLAGITVVFARPMMRTWVDQGFRHEVDDLPDAYANFYKDVSIYRDGAYVMIRTDAVPDHHSPYFSKFDHRHEPYNGDNPHFHKNPHYIEAHYLNFRIPIHPTPAKKKRPTPLGPIGVALNGVPIFNQYARGHHKLTSHEVNSFDQYNGHPQEHNLYHYHIEPIHLTTKHGKSSLIGFLIDGYPIYGPEEEGKIITNKDLDEYHGHSHPTPEYPEGIYHYHVTEEAPYVNGIGFFGEMGKVSHH